MSIRFIIRCMLHPVKTAALVYAVERFIAADGKIKQGYAMWAHVKYAHKDLWKARVYR
jgi:hypothetical protein